MGPTDDIRGLGVTRDRMPPSQRPVTQTVPSEHKPQAVKPAQVMSGLTLDLEAVKEQLAQGIRVKVPGFGTFKPRGRNVTFSVDKELKDLLKPAGPQRPDEPLGDSRTAPDGQSRTPPF